MQILYCKVLRLPFEARQRAAGVRGQPAEIAVGGCGQHEEEGGIYRGVDEPQQLILHDGVISLFLDRNVVYSDDNNMMLTEVDLK